MSSLTPERRDHTDRETHVLGETRPGGPSMWIQGQKIAALVAGFVMLVGVALLFLPTSASWQGTTGGGAYGPSRVVWKSASCGPSLYNAFGEVSPLNQNLVRCKAAAKARVTSGLVVLVLGGVAGLGGVTVLAGPGQSPATPRPRSGSSGDRPVNNPLHPRHAEHGHERTRRR